MWCEIQKGLQQWKPQTSGFSVFFFWPSWSQRTDMATVEQGCRGPSLCSWSTSSPLQCWAEGHMCSKLDQSQRSYKSGRPSFEKGDNFTIQSWTCPSLLNHLPSWRKERRRHMEWGREQVHFGTAFHFPFSRVRSMFISAYPWVPLDILKPGFA